MDPPLYKSAKDRYIKSICHNRYIIDDFIRDKFWEDELRYHLDSIYYHLVRIRYMDDNDPWFEENMGQLPFEHRSDLEIKLQRLRYLLKYYLGY